MKFRKVQMTFSKKEAKIGLYKHLQESKMAIRKWNFDRICATNWRAFLPLHHAKFVLSRKSKIFQPGLNVIITYIKIAFLSTIVKAKVGIF